MIKPEAIDHVCLWVRSLARSRVYYERLFGLECTVRPGAVDTLLLESEQVHFFLRECREETRFIEQQHLSFVVKDLCEIVTTLEEQGIRDYGTGEVTFMKYRNYAWCEWKDPDGIRLECIEFI